MTFDWVEFHDFAKALNTDQASEVETRCAISRAYYAAFCLARNFLRDQDGDASFATRGNVHDYVRKIFFDSPQRVRHQIGVNLSRLKEMRQRADYDDNYEPITQNIARDMRVSISMAQFIINELKTLPPRRR